MKQPRTPWILVRLRDDDNGTIFLDADPQPPTYMPPEWIDELHTAFLYDDPEDNTMRRMTRIEANARAELWVRRIARELPVKIERTW